MNDSQRALVEVLGLAEMATPGDFTVAHGFNVFAGDGSSATGLQTNYSDSYGRNVANAAYIAAACNYVRAHGPDLLARLAAAELDGARYRYLRDSAGGAMCFVLTERREPEEWDAEIDAEIALAATAGEPFGKAWLDSAEPGL